jgi:hypothetical protein
VVCGGWACTAGGTRFEGTTCWTSYSGCTAAGGSTEFGAEGTITADAASIFLTLMFLPEWQPIVLFFLLKHVLVFSGTCCSCCVAGCCVSCVSCDL